MSDSTFFLLSPLLFLVKSISASLSLNYIRSKALNDSLYANRINTLFDVVSIFEPYLAADTHATQHTLKNGNKIDKPQKMLNKRLKYEDSSFQGSCCPPKSSNRCTTWSSSDPTAPTYVG
jgi:hypothetical protein